MLGRDVEAVLRRHELDCVVSDKEIDICNADRLKEFSKSRNITWIINCSGYTAVDKAEDEAEIANAINGDGVLNIARIAREINAKLIHISTDYVFDGTKEGAYTETDLPRPLGAYGKSKLIGDENVLKTLDRFFIIRTSWLYGLNGNNFVKTMLKLFREREDIRVVSDQYGSPTYSEDLANFIIHILSDDSNEFGIYHFSNEGKTNWYELTKSIYAFAREFGLVNCNVSLRSITTEEYPTKAERPKNSYLSKEKMKDVFQYTPRRWEDSLKDFLRINRESLCGR